MAIPPIDELTQDLYEPRWKIRSDGAIVLGEKEDIKQRLGRFLDYGDALAFTFYPIFYDVELLYKTVVWR